MICAWIGENEIVPFDNIECVVFDEYDNELKYADVAIAGVKDVIRISGPDVDAFKAEYVGYLKHISKAMELLGDDQ